MDDRRDATQSGDNNKRKWLGWALGLSLVLSAVLSALIGYTFAYLSTYRNAEMDYAPIVVAAFYDSNTRHELFERSRYSTDIKEELDKTLAAHGEVESYRIMRVDPGPAKTFIDVRAVRSGKEFDEQILFIARGLADFTSEPARKDVDVR